MVNVLVIAILVIPWLIIPVNGLPDPTRLIKASFFDITLFLIIVMALKQGLKYEYKNKYLAFLSAWIFLTFVFNWYYPLDRGLGYNAGTIDSMIHVTLSIVATLFVCSSLARIDFVRCAKAICISATLISIFCIFQGIGLDPMKHIAGYGWKEKRHIAALLDNPDIVGNYICMLFPFFLYFNKPKYYICLGLCVVALILSGSSISMVAAFTGLFFYILFKYSKNKRILLALISSSVIFIGICFLIPSINKFNGGFTGRTIAWKMMLDRQNNPLFGEGLGCVKGLNVITGQSAITKDAANHWVYAHNDYLETYCSLGVLGLFLLILLIVHTFRNFNYKEDNQIGFAYFGAFVAFLVVMIASFPMEMPPIALNGLIFYWAMQRT